MTSSSLNRKWVQALLRSSQEMLLKTSGTELQVEWGVYCENFVMIGLTADAGDGRQYLSPPVQGDERHIHYIEQIIYENTHIHQLMFYAKISEYCEKKEAKTSKRTSETHAKRISVHIVSL
jgi:hypothetical protein